MFAASFLSFNCRAGFGCTFQEHLGTEAKVLSIGTEAKVLSIGTEAQGP